MSEPLVSIIVNCFNSERFLKDALDSIYQQDYSNWEIIFWDNASTDGSAEIAKSYDSHLKYFKSSETTSLGKARNKAMSKATGKYIAFLDCDDKYLKDKTSIQVNVMESGDTALCYGGVFIINEDSVLINKNKVSDKSGYLFDHLLINYEINMQSVMIRRSILLDNNLSFDPSLQFSPDYDLFMRIASEYKLSSVSNFLVEYRKSDNSLTSKMIEYIAPEMEYTLNSLREKLSKKNIKINNFDKAVQMLDLYKSLPFIQIGEYKEARRLIFKATRVKKRFYIYIFLMLLPVKSKWMLKKILR
jgi:glycosyltransferase involved in cell wall biosynthesis